MHYPRRPLAAARSDPHDGSAWAQAAFGAPAVGWVASDAFVQALLSDESVGALRPTRPDLIAELVLTLTDSIARSPAPSTAHKDALAWKKYWIPFVPFMGTDLWRPDVTAGCGQFCLRREVFLLCAFFMWVHQHMKPRSRQNTQARPSSAMNVVGSLRRSHDRAGITLVSPRLLVLTLKGAERRYVEEHSPDALKPERKNPYSKADIEALNALPCGFIVCGRTLD